MMELEELVSHSNITNLEDVAILKDFGVHLIVNLYCIRGKNFCADAFKKAVTDEKVSTMTAHKLYRGLQLWRRAACEVNDAFSTPETF